VFGVLRDEGQKGWTGSAALVEELSLPKCCSMDAEPILEEESVGEEEQSGNGQEVVGVRPTKPTSQEVAPVPEVVEEVHRDAEGGSVVSAPGSQEMAEEVEEELLPAVEEQAGPGSAVSRNGEGKQEPTPQEEARLAELQRQHAAKQGTRPGAKGNEEASVMVEDGSEARKGKSGDGSDEGVEAGKVNKSVRFAGGGMMIHVDALGPPSQRIEEGVGRKMNAERQSEKNPEVRDPLERLTGLGASEDGGDSSRVARMVQFRQLALDLAPKTLGKSLEKLELDLEDGSPGMAPDEHSRRARESSSEWGMLGGSRVRDEGDLDSHDGNAGSIGSNAPSREGSEAPSFVSSANSDANLVMRKLFSDSQRKFVKDVEKRLLRKDYLLMKAVSKVTPKQREELITYDVNPDYDANGRRVGEEAEEKDSSSAWEDFRNDSDSSDDGSNADLKYGGAEMRQKMERKHKMEKDVESAIDKKEQAVMLVVDSMTRAEIFELLQQISADIPMDMNTARKSKKSKGTRMTSGSRLVMPAMFQDDEEDILAPKRRVHRMNERMSEISSMPSGSVASEEEDVYNEPPVSYDTWIKRQMNRFLEDVNVIIDTREKRLKKMLKRVDKSALGVVTNATSNPADEEAKTTLRKRFLSGLRKGFLSGLVSDAFKTVLAKSTEKGAPAPKNRVEPPVVVQPPWRPGGQAIQATRLERQRARTPDEWTTRQFRAARPATPRPGGPVACRRRPRSRSSDPGDGVDRTTRKGTLQSPETKTPIDLAQSFLQDRHQALISDLDRQHQQSENRLMQLSAQMRSSDEIQEERKARRLARMAQKARSTIIARQIGRFGGHPHANSRALLLRHRRNSSRRGSAAQPRERDQDSLVPASSASPTAKSTTRARTPRNRAAKASRENGAGDSAAATWSLKTSRMEAVRTAEAVAVVLSPTRSHPGAPAATTLSSKDRSAAAVASPAEEHGASLAWGSRSRARLFERRVVTRETESEAFGETIAEDPRADQGGYFRPPELRQLFTPAVEVDTADPAILRTLVPRRVEAQILRHHGVWSAEPHYAGTGAFSPDLRASTLPVQVAARPAGSRPSSSRRRPQGRRGSGADRRSRMQAGSALAHHNATGGRTCPSSHPSARAAEGALASKPPSHSAGGCEALGEEKQHHGQEDNALNELAEDDLARSFLVREPRAAWTRFHTARIEADRLARRVYEKDEGLEKACRRAKQVLYRLHMALRCPRSQVIEFRGTHAANDSVDSFVAVVERIRTLSETGLAMVEVLQELDSLRKFQFAPEPADLDHPGAPDDADSAGAPTVADGIRRAVWAIRILRTATSALPWDTEVIRFHGEDLLEVDLDDWEQAAQREEEKEGGKNC